MAIFEKEVWVTLNGNNIGYYVSLGYNIEELKTKDIHGRLRLSNGTKLLVKVSDLLPNSRVKITKICDDCGIHVKDKTYLNLYQQREKGDGKDRCKKCGGIKAAKTKKENICYEDSLEYYAKENNKEYLLNELSSKNNKNPSQIFSGSGDILWWDCHKCKSEYEMIVHERKRYNCPYCRGYRVNNKNCLWATHPQIAKLLKNEEDGFEYTHGSHTELEFKCENCQNKEYKKIYQVVKRGFSCSKCSDGISYPEKFMMSVLDQLQIMYKKEMKFDWSSKDKNEMLNKDKKYDFYLQYLNMIIETHGVQHYEESNRGRSLQNEKDNDMLKKDLALNNGIEDYIIIDCKYSEMEYIKNTIVKSKLNIILDLTKIDWLKCHEYACNSLVKTTCELWNAGITSINQLSKLMRLSIGTTKKYLKQGNELNWCRYDPIKNYKEAMKLNHEKKKRKIIQLSKDNKMICMHPSITHAAKKLDIKVSGIIRVCKKGRKTAGGYKWMYKEDYDKLVANT